MSHWELSFSNFNFLESYFFYLRECSSSYRFNISGQFQGLKGAFVLDSGVQACGADPLKKDKYNYQSESFDSPTVPFQRGWFPAANEYRSNFPKLVFYCRSMTGCKFHIFDLCLGAL